MRIGLLNNLRAGRSGVQVGRLLGLLKDHPEVAHIETTHAAAVPEALAELSAQGVDLLVVNGGDGTLQHALTEILAGGEFGDRVPMIAALRGGRTNMSALDFGAHRDPVRGLKGLIADVRAGRIEERMCERPVLRVEYGAGRDTIYGMFFGLGVIPRGIEQVRRLFPTGRSQGVFGATVVTAALLARRALLRDTAGVLHPDKLQLLLDDEMLPMCEYTLGMACTLERLFAGLRPFWGEGPGGVRFTSIASGAPDLWKSVPGILAGRPGARVHEGNGYTSRNARRLIVGTSCGFTVDGEIIPAEPDRIVKVTANDRVRFVRA